MPAFESLGRSPHLGALTIRQVMGDKNSAADGVAILMLLSCIMAKRQSLQAVGRDSSYFTCLGMEVELQQLEERAAQIRAWLRRLPARLREKVQVLTGGSTNGVAATPPSQRSQAKAHHVRRGAEAHFGGSEGAVGEAEGRADHYRHPGRCSRHDCNYSQSKTWPAWWHVESHPKART
jgi:hypothetical protein